MEGFRTIVEDGPFLLPDHEDFAPANVPAVADQRCFQGSAAGRSDDKN